MKISALQKTYENRKVLNFPGAELEKGKIYAVIGANGSGKSTFSRILAGTLEADGKSRPFEANCRVGYMPQKSYGFRMSVRANVELGGSDRERADALLAALQLSHLEKKRADKLSGGETARMALARVLMKTFDVLILDEPTAPMDMETTILAEEQIRNYAKETQAAVILVTHSLQQARRLADEVLFFRKGELTEKGQARQMLERPSQKETQGFLDFYGR